MAGDNLESRLLLLESRLATVEATANMLKADIFEIRNALQNLATKDDVMEVKSVLPSLATKDDMSDLSKDTSDKIHGLLVMVKNDINGLLRETKEDMNKFLREALSSMPARYALIWSAVGGLALIVGTVLSVLKAVQ